MKSFVTRCDCGKSVIQYVFLPGQELKHQEQICRLCHSTLKYSEEGKGYLVRNIEDTVLAVFDEVECGVSELQ